MKWIAIGVVLFLLIGGCSDFKLRAKQSLEIEFSTITFCDDGSVHIITHEMEIR